MRRAAPKSDEATFDPIAEELADAIARLGDPYEGMTRAERKAAERKAERRKAKWQRRIDNAIAAWHALPIAERKEWAEGYLRRERKLYNAQAKMPKADDLPLLYAIVVVCERDNAKARKAYEQRKAEVAAQAAAEPSTPRATSPSPVIEEPAADAEPPKPEKPRRRRRGPAVGPAGYQIDGVFYPPIYDEDD